MSRTVYGNLDIVDNQLLNVRLQVLGSDPSPLEAKVYYNSANHEIRYHDGTSWKALGVSGSGGPPSGAAGGDLAGTYPNPQLAAGVIVDADINASAAIAQSKVAGLAASLSSKAAAATTVAAGAGLTGGGDLTANRSLDVGAGAGITVTADAVAVDTSVVQAKSDKGVAGGYAPLDAGGLVPTAHIPPLAINDVFTVASEAAMLALTAQRGDMAIRTDTGLTYVLAAEPATVLANWKEVTAAGQVTSVNGQTGVVTITAASLGAAAASTQVIAGAGLTGGGDLTASRTLNVANADGTLTVAADDVKVASAPKWTTARAITLGGDLSGSVSLDGSADATLTATLAAGAGGKRYAAALAASASQVVTHNLGTRDVQVAVYNGASPYEEVDVEVQRTTVNTVTVLANPALPAGYRVVVLA